MGLLPNVLSQRNLKILSENYEGRRSFIWHIRQGALNNLQPEFSNCSRNGIRRQPYDMEIIPQNNNVESPEKEPAPLEVLRGELADLKKAELAKKEKDGIYDPHFDDIEPADLSDDDLRLYQRLKNGELTMSELKKIQGGFTYSREDYRDHILGDAQTKKQPIIKYNGFLLRWIINKAMDMEYGKELKKAENEEK